MSHTHQTLQLSPPVFGGGRSHPEHIISPGHLCTYCQGNGFFWSEVQQEQVKIPCPICKGSGKLDAHITIEWQPATLRTTEY